MARRKNVKRIDPRYFLHETVNRGEEELEEWRRGYGDPRRKTPGETDGARGRGKYEKGEKPSWLDSPLDKWERDNPEAVRQHKKEFGLDEEELEEGSLKKLFGKKGLGMDVKDAARDVGGALADLPSDIKKAWKNRGGPSDEEKWEKIASGAELDESEE